MKLLVMDNSAISFSLHYMVNLEWALNMFLLIYVLNKILGEWKNNVQRRGK